MALRIVGLGGSLRVASRSRAALAVALDGAAAAGATIELLDLRRLALPMFDLRRLALPMFDPDREAEAPAAVRTMIETCYGADGLLWSSPMYNGSVSGSFKNAIDWLHMLGSRDPAYLHDKVVGLISAAGGIQGLQVIDTMDFSARSLRAWAVPYAVSVSGATAAFGDSGAVEDAQVESQLRALGAEVARVAERFADDLTLHRAAECERAAARVARAA